MRFKWYRVLWNIIWLPFMYISLFLFCFFIALQHLNISTAIDHWNDTI